MGANLSLTSRVVSSERHSSHGSLGTLLLEARSALHPHSSFIKVWHHLIVLAILFQFILLPFVLSFTSERVYHISSILIPLYKRIEFQIFYLIEIFFLLDFYVQLHTGYYEHGKINRDATKTRTKYLRSFTFALDLIAILPFGLYWSSTPWAEVHKILRVRRVPILINTFQSIYARYIMRLKLLLVIISLLLTAHILACIRFSFGTSSDPSSWLPVSPVSPSRFYFYLQAYFWTLGLLTGTFEGNLPSTSLEYVFTMIVLACGLIFFMYLSAVLFLMSKSENHQIALATARIHQLKHMLTYHQVPEILQIQAVEYIKRYYTDAESNDREALKLLCPSIAKDIQVELLRETVARIPVFYGCSTQFITAITSLLEMTSFPADFELFVTGDPGDCMYVVNSGVLRILVNDIKVRELRKGDFFGEVSVFSHRPRSATVVTSSYATLYKLSQFHIDRVLAGYPHYAEMIVKTVEEIVSHEKMDAKPNGNEVALLTTLYHRPIQTNLKLTTRRPRSERRKAIQPELMGKGKKKVARLIRSKSAQELSISRRSEMSQPSEIEGSETRDINIRERSKSMAIKRPPVTVRPTFHPPDTRVPVAMQGFYDKLSRVVRAPIDLPPSRLAFLHVFLLSHAIPLNSKLRKIWLVLLEGVWIYNLITIPLAISFIWIRPLLTHLDLVVDLFLYLDLYFNANLQPFTTKEVEPDFFTSTLIPTTSPPLNHPFQAAIKYLKHGAFLLDLMSALPYPYLFSHPTHRILARLPRFLCLWRFPRHVREWARLYPNTTYILHSMILVGLVLLLHWITCLHFGMTMIYGFAPPTDQDTWLPAAELNPTISTLSPHSLFLLQYTRSFYFATTMVTTLGKTVEPTTSGQYLVSIGCMLLGFLFFAVLVDWVRKRWTASAYEQSEFLITRGRIEHFLSAQNAPIEVRQRVNAFLDFWWSAHRGAMVKDLLNDLPEKIKRQVLYSICLPAIQTLGLLSHVQPVLPALEQVFIEHVVLILYGQREDIYRQGDYATGLFFLLQGQVTLTTSTSVRDVSRGGFFGTASLHLTESAVSYAENATAVSGCILLFLSREHLQIMHKTFPTFSMALKALEKHQTCRPPSPIHPVPVGSRCFQWMSQGLRCMGCSPNLVIDPEAKSSTMWQALVLMLVLFQSLRVIRHLCLNLPYELDLYLTLAFELCFLFDLVFQSRVGYYAYGNKIMDPLDLHHHYFHSFAFLLDAIALCPLYLFDWTFHIPWIRLNVLIRFTRAERALKTLETQFFQHAYHVRLIKLVLTGFVIVHVCGCLWLRMGLEPSIERNRWLPPVMTRDNQSQLYLESLLWSFGLLSASNAQEIPLKPDQSLLTIVVLLMGFFFLAYTIGQLSDGIELVTADAREFHRKLTSLRHLLSHFDLPPSLETKLKTYFFFCRFHSITQEPLLEQSLSPSLLTDIRLVHLQPMIVKVAFLVGMEGSVTRLLVSLFSQVLIVKGQSVTRYGDEGSDMFFVFNGVIEVLVPTSTLHRLSSDQAISTTSLLGLQEDEEDEEERSEEDDEEEEHVEYGNGLLMKKVGELLPGSYFGEIALFTNKRRTAHTRARTSSVLYKLSRRSLELVFERYPEWKKKVLKIATIQQEEQHLRNLYMTETQHSQAQTRSTPDIRPSTPHKLTTIVTSSSRQLLRGLSSKRFLEEPTPTKVNNAASIKHTTRSTNGNELWIDTILAGTHVQTSQHMRWLYLVTFATLFLSCSVPYRIAFTNDMSWIFYLLEYLCELIYAWDIIFNWNMKDSPESMELYEQHHREDYQMHRLRLDLLAIFPLDHFLSDFLTSPWLRLNRCVKIWHVPLYLQDIQRRSIQYETHHLISRLVIYLVVIYWSACLSYLILSSSSNPVLSSLYFAVTAFVKRGRTFLPNTSEQILFLLLLSVISLGIMSWMIGEMANLYVSVMNDQVEFRNNHRTITLYLRRGHVSRNLHRRAHAFLSSLWSSHRVNYQSILEEIPTTIRRDVILHIAHAPLRMAFLSMFFLPFTTQESEVDALTIALAPYLKYEGYPRDENVLMEGSIIQEMYFVVKGQLVSKVTTLTGELSRKQVMHYKQGDFFGERGLLGYSVSRATVKTVQACDLLSLSSEALLQVLLSRPLYHTVLSIAMDAYSAMLENTQDSNEKDETPMVHDTNTWARELYQVIESRHEAWHEAWWNGQMDANEHFILSSLRMISTPMEALKMFENLLRLIVPHGSLYGTRGSRTSMFLRQRGLSK